MSRPEDTGSRTVEDAASYERWRSKGDEDGGPDYDERPARQRSQGCTCNSRSLEPCDWCSEPAEPEEPEDPPCCPCPTCMGLCGCPVCTGEEDE